MPRREHPRLRLFVAVYPPAEVAEGLLEALGGVAGLAGAAARRVAAEQVHLTLQFLGPSPVRELERIGESIDRSAAGIDTFELTPLRLITLPERGRPRLVAAETDAPAEVMELKRRLALRLARSPRERPADRFLPHLTLCRFREGGIRAVRVQRELQSPAFKVAELRLMKSPTLPQGARHEPVRVFPLKGATR